MTMKLGHLTFVLFLLPFLIKRSAFLGPQMLGSEVDIIKFGAQTSIGDPHVKRLQLPKTNKQQFDACAIIYTVVELLCNCGSEPEEHAEKNSKMKSPGNGVSAEDIAAHSTTWIVHPSLESDARSAMRKPCHFQLLSQQTFLHCAIMSLLSSFFRSLSYAVK